MAQDQDREEGALGAAGRGRVFRYAISAVGCGDNSGGWGELGGNDFIEYNHDGGTIMHELGHTLNLHHGGDVDANCKPNYVSVMNYDQQFGIPQPAGAAAILDYSPPRFPGGRGAAPLSSLVENNLNENTILDGTDATNRFIFVNTAGNKVQNQLNLNPNYNREAYLHDTYTVKAFRGKGLAPHVRYEFAKALREMGRDRLYSYTSCLNTPAVKFKKKLNARILELGLYVELFDRFHWDWVLRRYRQP